jgi:(5-formylfuran-3-yl)methyl phosphate synthase
MKPERRQVRFLASVTSVCEARIAAANGATIIDCKDPASGALGALPVPVVRAIVQAVSCPVSATVGDLIPDVTAVPAAVAAMAAAGVDYVKIGFFPGGDAAATIHALGRLPMGATRLVGLLLADRHPDFRLIDQMAAAGFEGVMLDTVDKSSGALPDVLPLVELSRFIERAHSSGLFAGLAGALRLRHIPALASLQPDILGFRGALCKDWARSGPVTKADAAQ